MDSRLVTLSCSYTVSAGHTPISIFSGRIFHFRIEARVMKALKFLASCMLEKIMAFSKSSVNLQKDCWLQEGTASKSRVSLTIFKGYLV